MNISFGLFNKKSDQSLTRGFREVDTLMMSYPAYLENCERMKVLLHLTFLLKSS